VVLSITDLHVPTNRLGVGQLAKTQEGPEKDFSRLFSRQQSNFPVGADAKL